MGRYFIPTIYSELSREVESPAPEHFLQSFSVLYESQYHEIIKTHSGPRLSASLAHY